MPYAILQYSDVDHDTSIKSEKICYHNLVPASIIEQSNKFCSRSFIIRYCEEEVNLDHIVQFRSEVDLEDNYADTPFYLEAEMYFANLIAFGSAGSALKAFEKKVNFKIFIF